MTSIPEMIGGARVLFYTVIDERHQHTGNTLQIVAGKLMGPAYGLAICKYDDDAGFYLFGCDENWLSITDTYHPSVDEAKEQAEFEYEGVAETWQEATQTISRR